ncbi:IS701 family transposase [Streptomyces chrestomyceticus]|uniref:IS701 family transposase n=1 Tax=Streptomyces chrestomyceticus TaxID=68185 RepID=UPI0019D0CEE4|nr:transposase [Streptomyces chrestomyceticus]
MPASPTAVPPYLPGRPTSTQEAWVEDLCRHLFVSFNRADHHLKGEQYLRGLLTAPGRKSIRNIARTLDDTGAAQRLHHFICNAPWNWRTVREALADYLLALTRPRSWVVRPMLIPKSGTNSVGVHRHFVPATGQLVNGQLAYGLWYAGQSLNVPVDWRLHLQPPATGLPAPDDDGVPQILELVRRAANAAPGAAAPVVWDSQMRHAGEVLSALAPLGLPVMARTPGSLPLQLLDRSGRPTRRGALPAQRVLAAPERLGLQVHDVAPGVRAVLARVVPVRPGAGGEGGASGEAGELMLYAQRYEEPEGRESRDGRHGAGPRADFWLTTPTRRSPVDLHQFTRTAAYVARDSVRIGGRTGLRDFEGRSYEGWHRHMTLASAAYAVQSLTALDAVRAERGPHQRLHALPRPYGHVPAQPSAVSRERTGGPPLSLAG